MADVNTACMTAGIETLKALSQPGVYEKLEKSAAALESGINKAAASAGVKVTTSRIASLMTVFFTDKQPVDFETAAASDTALFNRFFSGVLSRGIYWPPSQFEAIFVSTAHTDDDIARTVQAVKESLAAF